MENKFGKKCTNLGLKFGVLFGGEIEQQIFCSSETFCLEKSLVKSTLGGYMATLAHALHSECLILPFFSTLPWSI